MNTFVFLTTYVIHILIVTYHLLAIIKDFSDLTLKKKVISLSLFPFSPFNFFSTNTLSEIFMTQK